MRKRIGRIIAVVVLLIALLAVGIYGLNMLRSNKNTKIQPSSAPVASASADSTIEADLLAGCPTDPKPIGDPVKFEIAGTDRSLPIVSLGLDADGAAQAPPTDQPYTIAWFNEGPRPGSDQGKVTLSSHTYRFGGAFGNDLLNGELKGGEIIKISDADGNLACYKYVSSTHIMEADYDENSDILYAETGDPQIALIVCTDPTSTGEWLGRMIYYADLVKGNA
uniref:class F sortase n=1 Tax=Vaginimicrobium propionicum TaxID=1871034 RepID=UPI00097123D6|nr:class F sortase [Vaginimicrobium propionicum]